ncbi:MAG: lipopolysaccharide biosynthesis protein [Oricola sp.]
MVKRALLLSTGERYVSLVVSFLTLAVVSRLLTPAEIGVSVIGMSILGIAMAVREFASSSFLIQQPELTPEDFRASFSVILMLTLVISAVLATMAPPLSALFGEPGLVGYLRVIALAILVDTLSNYLISILSRDMAFGRVAIIKTASTAVSSLSTITLAVLGFSFMSFAFGWLAGAVSAMALAVSFRPHFWMFKPSLSRARAVMRFGGYHGASYLLFMMAEQLPYALLGKIASIEAAAIYNRALTISQLPEKIFIGGAAPVILPAFAAEFREGRSLKKAYLHGLEIITALQWPALLVLAILAQPAVAIVLGAQWDAAVPVVRIFAVASLFSFSFALNDPVLTAVGAIRDVFIRHLVIFPVVATVVTLAAFLGGLELTALSMLFVIPFRAFISMRFVTRRLALRWTEIAAATRRSLVVTGTAVVGPLVMAVSGETPFVLPVPQALAAGGLAAAGWLAGLWMTGHPLRGEIAGAARSVSDLLFARPAAPGAAAMVSKRETS